MIVLEKAAKLGGTTIKSSGWAWYPNHARLRAAGKGRRQARRDALHGPALPAGRLRPGLADSGSGGWRYELLSTFYDRAADAAQALEDSGVAAVDLPDFPTTTRSCRRTGRRADAPCAPPPRTVTPPRRRDDPPGRRRDDLSRRPDPDRAHGGGGARRGRRGRRPHGRAPRHSPNCRRARRRRLRQRWLCVRPGAKATAWRRRRRRGQRREASAAVLDREADDRAVLDEDPFDRVLGCGSGRRERSSRPRPGGVSHRRTPAHRPGWRGAACVRAASGPPAGTSSSRGSREVDGGDAESSSACAASAALS